MIAEMTLTPPQTHKLRLLYEAASPYRQGLGPQPLEMDDVLRGLLERGLVAAFEGLYDVTPDGEQVLADNLFLRVLAGAVSF